MQDVMQPVHSSVTRWRKYESDKIPLLDQSLELLCLVHYLSHVVFTLNHNCARSPSIMFKQVPMQHTIISSGSQTVFGARYSPATNQTKLLIDDL